MKRILKKVLPKSFFSDAPTIPVVRMSGAIAAGGSGLRPPLSLESIATPLEKAFRIKDAPAVALILNSPGGSPAQSNLIHQRIRHLAKKHEKRVLIFVEDVAASGGYMIACAGDEIIADSYSIIGSIGVISAGFGFTEAISKLGVERRVYTSGENKSILDPFQPEKDEDIERLKEIQAEIHGQFIDLVKTSRSDHLDDSNPDLFTGAFWTSPRALELGLIDKIGNMKSELEERFGDKVDIRLISAEKSFLSRRLLGGELSSAEQIAKSAAEGLLQAVEERAIWNRYGL